MVSLLKKIPPEHQQLITETGLREYIPILPEVEELAWNRLEAGVEKYGFSWCEADLRTDIVEELLDVLNYPRMMIMRMKRLDELGLLDMGEDEKVRYVIATMGILEQVGDLIHLVYTSFPDVEGVPTNVWEMENRNAG